MRSRCRCSQNLDPLIYIFYSISFIKYEWNMHQHLLNHFQYKHVLTHLLLLYFPSLITIIVHFIKLRTHYYIINFSLTLYLSRSLSHGPCRTKIIYCHYEPLVWSNKQQFLYESMQTLRKIDDTTESPHSFSNGKCELELEFTYTQSKTVFLCEAYLNIIAMYQSVYARYHDLYGAILTLGAKYFLLRFPFISFHVRCDNTLICV